MKIIIVSGFDSTQMVKFASDKIDINNNERILMFPESGLHYSNIIKLFEEVFKNNFAKIAIITHSEFVITHIRRLVGEEKINYKNVEIYFIDENQNSIKIEIYESGSLSAWPKGFEEGLIEEFGKLSRIRRNVK
jgi:predicted ATPase